MRKLIDRIFYPVVEWIVSHDVRRKSRVNRFIRNHDVVKLHLGCYKNIQKGWLNTDKSLTGCRLGAIYMDVGERFLLPDSSADYVYAEHLFEHLKLVQAKNMLKESYRVMKPGGTLRLATPNIDFLMDLYQHPEKDINQRYIEWAANEGNIPALPIYVINRFHTAWGHQIIYDFDTLAALLKEYGFKDVVKCEMSKSSHPELCDIEGHFHVMPYVFACLETMIIEARK